MKQNLTYIKNQIAEINAIATANLPTAQAHRVVRRTANIMFEASRMERQQEARQKKEARGIPSQVGISHEAVTRAMSKRATDRDTVLRILLNGETLTTSEAIDMGIWHVATRVFELRQQGYNIKTERIQAGREWIARYILVE